MKLRKLIYILSVFIVIAVLLCNTFVSSALTTYNFVCQKPTITNTSCYFEIVDSSGKPMLFYVTIGLDGIYDSGQNNFDYELVSLNFDSTLVDGSLWIYPSGFSTQGGMQIESYKIYGFIIYQDGNLITSSISYDISSYGKAVGVYIGKDYKCLRGYNCYRTSRGSDIVFAYGNEINTNNKLDSIISAINGSNQEVIDNQDKNTDKVIQNQEENQEEIKNGWQQENEIDSSTTDDYAAKDKELQGATEQGRSETVSVFNNFGSLFTGDSHLYKGLLSVSAIFTEFFKIEWISSLINFSLALGVFAFVIGTGSAVFKSAHEKFNDRKSSFDERSSE